MTPELLELGKAAGALVAFAGLLTLLWKAARGAFRTTRKLGRLADEVLGDGEDRPGWGKRLTSIEGDVSSLRDEVREIQHEVKPNGGKSLRDDVRRIAEVTGATQ